MAWTQADLDRIEAAIATGTLTVEIDGRRVTYRSLDDMTRVRGMISRSLETDAVSGVPAGRRYGRFSRGIA